MNENFYHHLSERDLYFPLISVFLPVGDTEDFSDTFFFCVVFPGLTDPANSCSKVIQLFSPSYVIDVLLFSVAVPCSYTLAPFPS